MQIVFFMKNVLAIRTNPYLSKSLFKSQNVLTCCLELKVFFHILRDNDSVYLCFIYLFYFLYVYLVNCSFIHLFIQVFIHSLIYLFIYSFIQS